MKCFLLAAWILVSTNSYGGPILLRPGFLTKVKCPGRLYASAVGNEKVVILEALPKETGCGVLLKPMALEGQTNIILETSVGSMMRLVRIQEVPNGKKKEDGFSESSLPLPAFTVDVIPDGSDTIQSSNQEKK